MAKIGSKPFYFVQYEQKGKEKTLKISTKNFSLRYCFFGPNNVKYISLICDEAGGCHPEKWGISVEYVRQTGETKLFTQHSASVRESLKNQGRFPGICSGSAETRGAV